MTTHGMLKTSSQTGRSNAFYTQDFESGAPTYGGNWNPNEPATSPIFGSNALRVYQSSNPTVNSASFTVQIPAYTFNVIVSYDAQPFGSGVTGDITVVGSQSGSLLDAGVAPPTLVPGTWTQSSTPSLTVVPGETITVTFLSTNPGNGAQNTPYIDNIVVTGQTFDVVDVRPLLQIGNAYNNITVLRSCHCDTPQQYWLEVTDNVQAVKEMTTKCCDKECEAFPDPFTRILCLDLADSPMLDMTTCTTGEHPWPAGLRIYGLTAAPSDPVTPDPNWFNPTVTDNWQSTDYDGCGYSIYRRLSTELWVGTGSPSAPFRTRTMQGGFDGCTEQAKCTWYGGCPLLSNPYNNYKKRWEQVMSYGPSFGNNYWNGNSWYTVLCLEYTVRLVEYGQSLLTNVDCRRGADCRSQDVLVAKLAVDTECEGTPASQQPQLHSGDLMQLFIPANSSNPNEVLFANPAKGVYPGIGFDITLLDAQGNQFRGKRSKLFLPNCTFDRWAWSSATCLDCGYRQNFFMVLATTTQVKIHETPYGDRLVNYPDPRVLPEVTNTVQCSSGTCAVNQGSMFSRLWIQSFRGAPSLFANGNIPFVAVKFGNVVETALRLIHESWVFTDTRENPICVIADPRNEYSINWGPWASNTAGLDFADCSSIDGTVIDNCRNPGSNNALGAVVVPPFKRDGAAAEQKTEADASVQKLMKKIEGLEQ
eukprot:TRINITY_DN16906_c0_g3_i1.p1 TRINITY_DN16906_c0_g3~~TRINITY_DN16906_c0_g3_i1.p1  ORF type:complete len:748 (-),score=98.17 TRINITY_DN16906_c0_g3_i1:17-2122(-)